MHPVDCVPLQTLKEYLAGWTDISRSEQIESHLSNCPICEETIASLEADPDTLAVMVSSAANAPPDEAASLLNALSLAGRLIENNETSAREDSPEPKQYRSLIGPYLLLKPLGSGGMGSVYLARHQQLGKQVAIKLLPLRLSRRDHFEARFQREIRAAGGLDHPSIVSSTDAGVDQGTQFLVMEFIDGLDLSQLTRACGKLEIADACELIRQVALGLSHAHAAGIVHRDIKPSNLMLNRRGQAKILDFGLARLGPWNEFSAELTTVGQLMGTLDYMAPEQAERAEAVDYRADIYSLAATLFRLLCGRAPLAASPDQSPLAKLRLLATQDPPRLSTLRTDAPEALVELVGQMLARDPNERPASAAHVAERLEEFCSSNQLTDLIEKAIGVRASESSSADYAFPLDLAPLPLVATQPDPQVSKPQAVLENQGNQLLPSPSLSTSLSPSSNGSWSRWIGIGLACMLLAGSIYSGIIIWLDGQQGWLHIESEARVTVELVSDSKAATKWKIEPGENSTRLYAGKYRIILEQGSDGIEIDNDQLQVLKGGLVIAKIVKSKPESPALAADNLNNSSSKNGSVSLQPSDKREKLFKGRPLSEWIEVLPLERDVAGINDALNAIRAAISDQTKQEISEFLMSELPKIEWHLLGKSKSVEDLYKTAFTALLAANRDGYFSYLRQQLDGSQDEAWKTQILIHGLPANATSTEFVPVHEWLQQNVFSKQTPYLGTIAYFYLQKACLAENPQFWMQTLVDCGQLDDTFWLKSLEPEQNRTMEILWTELVRRAINTLADREADAVKIVNACAVVEFCPAELKSKLIDPNSERLADIWRFRAKQLADSEELRRTLVQIPQCFSVPVVGPTTFTGFKLKRPWLFQEPNNYPSNPFAFRDRTTVTFALVSCLGAYTPAPEELSRAVIPGAARALIETVFLDPWRATLKSVRGEPKLQFESLRPKGIGMAASVPTEAHVADFYDFLSLHQLNAVSDDRITFTPIAQLFLNECQRVYSQQLISSFDHDGDGKLSYDEAVELLLGKDLVTYVDQDKDQSITVDEYIKYRDKKLESHLERANIFFKKYDSDGDGKLSQAEQKQMPGQRSFGTDTNNDGMLDAQEYANLRRGDELNGR